MTNEAVKQNSVYLIVAVAMYFLIKIITPNVQFDPKGIVLPATKTTLAPSKSSVQLFQNTAPANSKHLADINIEMHSIKPSPAKEMLMLNKAKSLAQQVGADGLAIYAFGFEGAGPDNPSVLTKYVLFAKAVKLN